jgi:hypothetical protein
LFLSFSPLFLQTSQHKLGVESCNFQYLWGSKLLSASFLGSCSVLSSLSIATMKSFLFSFYNQHIGFFGFWSNFTGNSCRYEPLSNLLGKEYFLHAYGPIYALSADVVSSLVALRNNRYPFLCLQLACLFTFLDLRSIQPYLHATYMFFHYLTFGFCLLIHMLESDTVCSTSLSELCLVGWSVDHLLWFI